MQNLIDAIIPIIIFIAVISGIVTSIRESIAKKSKQQAPEVQQAPQSRVQAEIAAFLSAKQQSASGPQQDIRPQTTATAPKGNRPPQKNRQKSQRSPAKGQVTQKSKDSRSIGSGVAAHVESFIGGHVQAHIGREFEENVQKDMAQRVRSELGSQSSRPVEMSASDKGSVAADNLLVALRSPAGIRHAILVNEILSKPLALRK